MSEIWKEIIVEQKPRIRFVCTKCYNKLTLRTPDLVLTLFTECDICREPVNEILVFVYPLEK